MARPPAAAFVVALLAAPAARAGEPPDFARDVVPALTKVGCNAGTCHGAFKGRGGFRLSLLGFDPAADYDEIVRAGRGRRVVPGNPDTSPLFLKPTGAVPHGGGRRLTPDSPAYRILREYIAAGPKPSPPDGPRIVGLDVTPRNAVLETGERLALRVSARWSDGSARDVTAWALYDSRDPTAAEVSPTGEVVVLRPGKAAVSVRFMGQVASVALTTPFGPPLPFDFRPTNFIDDLTAAEWTRLGVAPAPLTTDEAFARRLHLDLTGTLPTPDEVRRFTASTDPNKRAKLIDDLLERPEYVDYWALRWADLLRAHRRYVGDKGLGSFVGWVRQSVRENKPLDRMTRELLTAQGNLFAHGPVAFYYVDQKPEELAETTAQLFLGVRMQCARCHHHPFEVWAQQDYYGLAAFFTRLELRETGDKGRFGGTQSLRVLPAPAEARKLQVASPPRLLGAAGPLPESPDDVRQNLAAWVTAKENPFFARNFANRYWAVLTGRGLVEPVDDLRDTNPATNPALLDALAKDFAAHDFDAKHLLRTICTSRTYQLASELAPGRDRDGALFTHRLPRRLPAEVLLDAINQATGTDEGFAGTPPGTRAVALPDPTVVSGFLTAFGRPPRTSPCECARDPSPDLLQALYLSNSPALHAKLAAPKGRLTGLLARKRTDAEVAEELYLATVSRKPTATELRAVREILADAPTPKEGWEDVLWALLNGAEFSFNH